MPGRVDELIEWCRAVDFPAPLTDAIAGYLAGRGDLDAVRQAWPWTGYDATYHADMLVRAYPFDRERLDEIDRRLLDICIAVERPRTFLDHVATNGPLDLLCAELRRRGLDEAGLGRWLVGVERPLVDDDGRPTDLGRLVLDYLPAHFADLLRDGNDYQCLQVVRLLLTAEPVDVDLVWQAAQRMPAYWLGDDIVSLLQLDPRRFAPLAREVAGSTSRDSSRVKALVALLDFDPAAHLDLAVAALQTPLPSSAAESRSRYSAWGWRPPIASIPRATCPWSRKRC